VTHERLGDFGVCQLSEASHAPGASLGVAPDDLDVPRGFAEDGSPVEPRQDDICPRLSTSSVPGIVAHGHQVSVTLLKPRGESGSRPLSSATLCASS
jgi:hypothetical protein